MKLLLSAKGYKCRCRLVRSSLHAISDHIEAGECPQNAPSGRAAFITWSMSVRALTPREEERKEKDRAHLEELKNDPVAQENRRRKIEEKKALREARKRLLVRGRR